MSEAIIKRELPELAPRSVDVLHAFQQALMDLDEMRAELAASKDWNSLAIGLGNLVELKQQLSVIVDAIQKDIYELMPDKKQFVDGVGMLEKRRSNTKKWESDRLLRDIVRNKLYNEDGEVAPGTMALIDTLEKVLPLTGSLGWRVTALKDEGFDPDEYCSVNWGRPTISIQK